jgi:superoxide dismutase, Fe-Mn family
MALTLPALPYAPDALEPHISAHTLSFHHGKHHNAYVTNLNKMIDGTPLADAPLDEIVKAATPGPMFNNAAQAWNHTFYWESMSPEASTPSAPLAAAIDAAFGSLEAAVKALSDAAVGHFGSGWAWLVADSAGVVSVMSTHDADLPLAHGLHALLVIDVWEHAYYLDHQNLRAAYVTAICESLLNWNRASERYAAVAA